MPADPLDRIFSKLDSIDAGVSKVREEASADRAMLEAHLKECTERNAVIHKRIDDVKRTQRWWAGKLLGAALSGGGIAEIARQLFGSRTQ